MEVNILPTIFSNKSILPGTGPAALQKTCTPKVFPSQACVVMGTPTKNERYSGSRFNFNSLRRREGEGGRAPIQHVRSSNSEPRCISRGAKLNTVLRSGSYFTA